MTQTPVISIREGVPRHPDFRMASPVSLDIMPGEQVAILGPNAAGKTRLVDILTGRWPLLDGKEVAYAFRDPRRPLASDNIKVIAFRDSYGDGDATYYLQQRWNHHDIDESTPRVDGRYIISLSSGELRRHQLRQALRSRPSLLVLDNPFIGLDAEGRSLLRQTLARLIAEEGLQVVLVVCRESDIPDFVTRVVRVGPGCGLRLPGAPAPGQDGPPCGPPTASPPEPDDWADVLGAPAEGLPGEEVMKLTDVSVGYAGRTILSHLSWTVRRGERWALAGANGSGKSTLLSLVCADNPQAYACDIRLFGRRRGTGESIWDIKRHIGYVSPEMHRAYLRDLPAADIVASGLHDSVGLYVRPRPEEREACLRWMRRFGIQHLARRTFLRLSSGEQRLCLLARAFVKTPDLLILDEPFHGLDDSRRRAATAVIERYCSQRPGATLVVVSHYDEELPAGITHRLSLKKQG